MASQGSSNDSVKFSREVYGFPLAKIAMPAVLDSPGASADELVTVEQMAELKQEMKKTLENHKALAAQLEKLVPAVQKLKAKARKYNEVEKLVIQSMKVKDASADGDDSKIRAELYDKVEDLVVQNQMAELQEALKKGLKETDALD